jgi:membrane associated rhomboid family serine protease
VSETTPSAYSAGTIPHCYRHPDRETYIACQRCGRPICPDCMRQAAVGFQCPDCVRSGAASARTPRTSFGGKATASSSAVTLGLIGANIAVFLIAHATGGMTGTFTESMGLLPDSTPYAPSLGLQGVAQGSYWELITSTFLHLQVLHIAMNMIGLWIFGSFLESALGRWRYLALYLLTGLVGSVAVYWLAPPASFSLGASGSIFGLFAAALVVLLRQHRDVSQLLLLLVLNLVITFTVPDVSWQAHVGGLLSGLGLGVAFAYAPRGSRTMVQVAAMTALLAGCVVLVVLRTAALTT